MAQEKELNPSPAEVEGESHVVDVEEKLGTSYGTLSPNPKLENKTEDGGRGTPVHEVVPPRENTRSFDDVVVFLKKVIFRGEIEGIGGADDAVTEEELRQALAKVPATIETSNIQALTDEQIDNLKVGDVVQKKTGSEKHCYIVTYKQEKHGICLSYFDGSGYIETVSYDYTNGAWVYNSTDVFKGNEKINCYSCEEIREVDTDFVEKLKLGDIVIDENLGVPLIVVARENTFIELQGSKTYDDYNVTFLDLWFEYGEIGWELPEGSYYKYDLQFPISTGTKLYKHQLVYNCSSSLGSKTCYRVQLTFINNDNEECTINNLSSQLNKVISFIAGSIYYKITPYPSGISVANFNASAYPSGVMSIECMLLSDWDETYLKGNILTNTLGVPSSITDTVTEL